MIPRRVMLFACVFLVLMAVGSVTAWAQFTSGIEGTVSDPTGAVVPGATVTIKNEETGASQTVQTQDSGSFRFTTLPSSAFTISAAAQGFKTTVQEHIQLPVAETKTVNIRMVVGGRARSEVERRYGPSRGSVSRGSEAGSESRPSPPVAGTGTSRSWGLARRCR
jgi:Carboxypeptidase regulatory-like domain